jgi:predicted DNA-binding protein (MmcQ/YjbR family)
MDIETLQAFCRALPAVTEDIKWDNDLCFSVGGKMFCVAWLQQPTKISFKVPDEDFEEMAAREGIIPAPYMARAKWVQVQQTGKLSRKDWQFYLKQSYELVKAKLTKKQRADLGIG